jgi:hypothetical protein
MSQPVNSNIAQAEGRLTHAIGLSESRYTCARRGLLAIIVLLTLVRSSVCLAGEPTATGAPEAPKPVMSWKTGAGKSYPIPALETSGFILVLNGYDRFAYPNEVEAEEKIDDTNPSLLRDHIVHGPWGSDQENFYTNQFNHPYQGSMYYGFALSAGLNYGESLSEIASDKGVAGEPIATGVFEAPKPVLSWETGAGKSYLIPALEIPAFLVLLNMYDRFAYPNAVEPSGAKTYDTNLSTTWDHVVHEQWVIDRDPFSMNQFNHPYQGEIFHGFARSAGLSYWEALLYDNVGSYLWKMGGETGNPSFNDMITTGQAGSFLGEALFRMANLVLEGDGEKPGFWRELGAAILSPSMGFNRYEFDDRFKPVYPSHNPATFWRLGLGASLSSNLNDQTGSSNINRNEVTADFSMAYGLPGKPGYGYERPFDYFHFELTTLATADNPVEDIMIRGLLLGKKYEAGSDYRGIFGLYGGYDYISPHIFRVSSTSLSLGTTFQWWLSRAVALQGSALGGVGYAAAGNVSPEGERDYHYGVAPQGLLALRLILGDRAMFDLTGRAYYVSGMGGGDPGEVRTSTA